MNHPNQRAATATNYLPTVVSAVVASMALVACGPQGGSSAPAAAPATTAAVVPAPAPAATAQPVPAAPAPAPVVQAAAPVAVAAPAPAPEPMPAQAVIVRGDLGQVASIEAIHSRPRGTGTGAVIGGVLGGVIGNQFGGGRGRVATTALGAVGGAVVGNNIERNRNETIVGYRVSVRLDNGHTRTIQESSLAGLRVGDRVRVEDGRIRPV